MFWVSCKAIIAEYPRAMSLIRDQAVVLGRLDYSETSQVIVLLTREHGKVRAIAKGIKRGTKQRFAAAIDLLELGSVVLSARQDRPHTLANITEWKQTRSLLGLREKLHRLHAGQYVAEITAALTEDWDPHAVMYDALVHALVVLGDADTPLPAVTAYQQKLLDEIGSWPRFDACVLCGRMDELTHFSSFEGGMICRHCEPTHIEKREVGPITRAMLIDISTTNDPTPAFDLLDYHISHLMGRAPKLSEALLTKTQRGHVR